MISQWCDEDMGFNDSPPEPDGGVHMRGMP